MINIAFIVPYPELLDKVKVIIADYKSISQKEVNISLFAISLLEKLMKDPHHDVLVARGFAALTLRIRNSSIPVVELPITTCDIIQAVEECIEKYGVRRIALVGPNFSSEEIAVLDTMLPCSLACYDVTDSELICERIKKAMRDGCDSIIGGNTAHDCAERLGYPSVTIKTSENAIRRALDEAMHVVEVMRQERERSQMFTTISQCSKDGIMYVAVDNTILTANPASMQILDGGRNRIIGVNISCVSQEMCKNADEARRECREISNHLYRHGGSTLSVNYLPVLVGGSVTGVIITFQDITRIQQMETQIRQKLSEKGLGARYCFTDIIHTSESLNHLIEQARRYAAVSSNVLIEGETGTGKELFAQSIHNASARSAGPFVAINCAAIPENLLESEMFGYEEGAFTGTSKGGKIGLFELAHNGTLFLDEVSELPLNFQGKLLRVLQEREVRRVGANKVKAVDVRIIAASNVNLKRLVSQGSFRKDLFYRIDVLKLSIPPLSERPEDVKTLFLHFIEWYNGQLDTKISEVSPRALELLCAHTFDGNIRELKNTAERVSILCMDSHVVTEADIRSALYDHETLEEAVSPLGKIEAMHTQQGKNERDLIIGVLKECAGNQTRAARELGIDRTTLWRKLRKHSISRV
ncbi:MAG: sigma 54-interacting transcriptional regulator [Spirochaetales bacterium]|jgi:PAS domain S-box-containing protein|nr:sigma 54-interacting transcriptional regulator [Spirochaetales bacterium]